MHEWLWQRCPPWRLRRCASAEAKVLQREVARKIDSQRLGLDPIPVSDMTVGELLNWWLDTYSKRTPSHRRNESAVKRHLLAADLAKMQLHLLSKGDVETLLLRGFIDRL